MASKDQIKAWLAEKIDSYEKWNEFSSKVGYYGDELWVGKYPETNTMNFGRTVQFLAHWRSLPKEVSWWLRREVARQSYEVYPAPTEVLANLLAHFPALGPMFPHISKEDPNMVAYTASMEDGLRDKQTRTTIGKFLRRFLLLVTDAHIQQLEASHRAEMDPNFPVARTPQEIERVYRNMAGDSGCMRYSSEHFGLPPGVHPSHAYAYEGLGVAYTEDPATKLIKSRSVIYDNPKDPSDKRYVRIYGDPALKKKLERAGYKLKALTGVKLRLIDMRKLEPSRAAAWRSKPFVVPYLDGPGGNQEMRDGSYGYAIRGEDCLNLITKDQARRLEGMGYEVPSFKNTAVLYYFKEVEPDALLRLDVLDNEKFNLLDHSFMRVWHEGKVGWTRENNPKAPRDFMYVLEKAERVVVRVDRETRDKLAFLDTFSTGNYCIDTPEMRRNLRYVPLDPEFYKTGDKWVWLKNAIESKAGSGVYYRKEDCGLVFNERGDPTWVPLPRVEELKQDRDYVPVAPRGEEKALSHRSNPNLVMTLGKRRCVIGWHSVVQLHTGEWDYAQNVRSFQQFGESWYYSVKESDGPPKVAPTEAMVRKTFADRPLWSEDYSSDIQDRQWHLNRNLSDSLYAGWDGRYFFVRANVIFRGSTATTKQSDATMETMKLAAERLSKMSDQEIIDTYDESYLIPARAWSAVCLHVAAIYDEAVARWTGRNPSQAAAQADAAIDELLTATAVHIRDERFPQAS